MDDSASLPLQLMADPESVSASRALVLVAALRTSSSFRTFIANGRPRHNPARDEAELWFMLESELQSESPRRSMLKRLHGAIVNVRQRREWAHIESHCS